MLNMKHVVMAALTLCALLATSPSYAQKETGLTAESVRAFMDEIVYAPGIGPQSLKARYSGDVTIMQEQEL